MANTLTYEGTLVIRRCWCGIRHAVPSELDRALENDRKQNAFCPLGHSYVSSSHERLESERLRAQLVGANAQIDQARAEAEHQRARANGMKGALVKTKKRIGKGVCPSCNRHFANVERHMQSQHPEVANGDVEKAPTPA